MRTKYLIQNIYFNFGNLHTEYKVATMEDIKTNLRKPGGDTLSFERTIEKITFTNNITIVMGQESRIIAGKTDKRRYTNIWMNNKNNWQIVARQTTIFSVQ